jgi:hypothetical protein
MMRARAAAASGRRVKPIQIATQIMERLFMRMLPR